MRMSSPYGTHEGGTLDRMPRVGKLYCERVGVAVVCDSDPAGVLAIASNDIRIEEMIETYMHNQNVRD